MDGERPDDTSAWLEEQMPVFNRVTQLNDAMLAREEDGRFFAEHLSSQEMRNLTQAELAEEQLGIFPDLVQAQQAVPYESLMERLEGAEAALGEVAVRREALHHGEFDEDHDMRNDIMVIQTRRPELAERARNKLEDFVAQRHRRQAEQLQENQSVAESRLESLRHIIGRVGAIALPTLAFVTPEPYKRVVEGFSTAVEISREMREAMPAAREEPVPVDTAVAQETAEEQFAIDQAVQESEQARETHAVAADMLEAGPDAKVATAAFASEFPGENPPVVTEPASLAAPVKSEPLSDEAWHQISPGWRFGDYLARHAGEQVLDEDIAEEVYGSRDQRSVQMVRSLAANTERAASTPLSERLQQDGLVLRREKRAVERPDGAGKRGPRHRQYIGAFRVNEEEQP